MIHVAKIEIGSSKAPNVRLTLPVVLVLALALALALLVRMLGWVRGLLALHCCADGVSLRRLLLDGSIAVRGPAVRPRSP